MRTRLLVGVLFYSHNHTTTTTTTKTRAAIKEISNHDCHNCKVSKILPGLGHWRRHRASERAVHCQRSQPSQRRHRSCSAYKETSRPLRILLPYILTDHSQTVKTKAIHKINLPKKSFLLTISIMPLPSNSQDLPAATQRDDQKRGEEAKKASFQDHISKGPVIPKGEHKVTRWIFLV